ncbi:hypothetical protein GQ457_13G006570 [Hibiscus cannabinus]
MKICDWVLESGHWHIEQKAIVLRRWTHGLIPEILSLDTTPVWLRLWHVPLELYSQQWLSYLASALGKPLYTDRTTTLKICVDIAASFTLPISVLVDLGDGNIVDIEEKCFRKGVAQTNVGTKDGDALNSSSGTLDVDIGYDGGSVIYEDNVVQTNVVQPVGQGIKPMEIEDGINPVGAVGSSAVVSNNVVSIKSTVCIPCVEVEPIDIIVPVEVPIVNEGLLGSNKFEVLVNKAVEHEGVVLPLQKVAGGVAKLLNQLKPKPKGLGPGRCNDPLKHNRIVTMVRNLKIGVLCLLETRVKENNAMTIIREYGFFFEVSDNLMCNGREEMKRLWHDLFEFKVVVGGSPWGIAGDFNIISCSQESSDFDGSQSITGAMHEFLNCREDIDVVDHSSSGPLFTWCNRREDALLVRKLDMFIVNQAWLEVFSDATVEFLSPNCSDHCPSYLILKSDLVRLLRPFKFFNFWLDHPGFMKIVGDSWLLHVFGNHLHILFTKLKRLKPILKQFNKEVFGEISKKVQAKQIELSNVQKLVLATHSADFIVSEKKVAGELIELSKSEEKKLKVYHKANTIHSLQDRNGVRLDTFEAISREFIQLFSESLGAVDSNVKVLSDDLLREILDTELSLEIHNHLVAPVTQKEIKDVLFSMNGNKALRPDGFPAKFFQAT